MRCEDCQNLLLDLAYGELDEARAIEVRAHAESCAECSAEWSKLSRGRSAAAMLPVALAPAASPALLAAIDAAVSGTSDRGEKPRERSADRSGARNASGAIKSGASKTQDGAASSGTSKPDGASDGAATESGGGGTVVPMRGARWLERIAALAMRREVAMAAVFLMAVGVGVTTLYNPSRNPAVTEADRASEVIPAVVVSQDLPAATGRSAARRAGPSAADPESRARMLERQELPRGARPSATPSANTASAGMRSGDHRSTETANDDEGRARELSGNTAPSVAPLPVQQPAQNNVLPQFAARNAGFEVGGVQRMAASPSELAARSALERGDPIAALSHFRSALAAASDDVTRARLQREISTLETTQALQAANNAQAANGPSNVGAAQAAAQAVSVQQTGSSESSYRRPARARSVQRPMPAANRSAGSNDSYNAAGF
jgi:hypothetical protein